MYIHLGRDYVLNDRDIIGIFNLETTTISPRGREFLNYAQKNGAVVSLSEELPQSYVLADGAVVDTVPSLPVMAMMRHGQRLQNASISEVRIAPLCAAARKKWWNEKQHRITPTTAGAVSDGRASALR